MTLRHWDSLIALCAVSCAALALAAGLVAWSCCAGAC